MSEPSVEATDLVTLTIDGTDVSVPKGEMVIRAAEQLGVAVPRFCDHPLLDPVAACRACLVDVLDAGNGRPMKPQPACALEVAPGMKIATAASSQVARDMQSGILEFLLINHPLDCPMCDKAGECPLQNQAVSHGPLESRYDGAKRRFPKSLPLSALVLLDRERCVLCQRCTRFSEQISGDPLLALVERGAKSQIGAGPGCAYDSYFSGNVVQICPVGALTSADYRFQARPVDLASTPTTCENCAAGCALRTDARHYAVKRRLAAPDPSVNDDWNCDKGRFAFRSGHLDDRLTTPLIRRGTRLEPASWPEALDAAAQGLMKARRSVGVLPGGRLTHENALAYSRFARAVVGNNNIDFRARAISEEETTFLTWLATRKNPDWVDYRALDAAKQVVLVCLEPEDECPMIFLRLRKAWRRRGLPVTTIAAYASRGSHKMGARLRATRPGTEASVLRGMADAGQLDAGTIVLLGERAALAPGLLSEVARLADDAGLRFAWVPRRAGEMGALQAGCLPGLLPAGHSVADDKAKIELAAMWHMPIPDSPGLDTQAMLEAAAAGSLSALLVGGVEPADLRDPALAHRAFGKAYTISLEQRVSEVTQLADVVFPVALLEEQEGTFVNWTAEARSVGLVNPQAVAPMPDVRVLSALARAMGKQVAMRNMRNPAQARAIYAELDVRRGIPAPRPSVRPGPADVPRLVLDKDVIEVTLAGWRQLLDGSRCLDGADALVATAPAPVMRLSAVTAAKVGLSAGAVATLSAGDSTWTGPVEITSMVDDVVWIPLRSVSECGRLDAQPGDRVRLGAGGAA
ncbi:MAG: NADH-quinone oxidoreductase subunit G [Actinomycetia bacterium]|nr:NADH-quinone oxidoreductase subunit G [Actinomycetes bacterium]